MYVIKRDGSRVEFNKNKIAQAILNAMIEVDGKIYETDTANDIADDIANSVKTDISVEDIQNKVEEYLMRSERKDVARAYIRYRYKKEVARNYKSDFLDAIAEKLNASNVVNQNANVDEHSFGGRTGEASSVMTKKYALEFIVSDMARKNHEENRIYIHDLDAYAVGSHNCLSIPFDKLLANGFNTRQADIRPANSVGTAMQLVAVIFQLQSLQQFGGVSATHLDWTMVPYVRKSFFKHWKDGIKYIGQIYIPDDIDIEQGDSEKSISSYPKDHNHLAIYEYALAMTKKELNQSVEAMYHNLNTLQSRSGNQLPFTSINYGTCTLPEGRMVTEALLNGSIKGVGKLHKTSIFPCGIFQCMKGINRAPGDPNYDLYQLALKSTAQRLYPNYVNVDWSNNEGYDRDDPTTYVSTMGCRTYNGADINANPGVNPQTKDGRGNIAPTTIILPTIAMEAIEMASKENLINGDYLNNSLVIECFMKNLDKAINEAKDMLIERYEWICSQNPASARFMYENGTMEGYVPEEGIRSALKHGTLAIGQLGLAECLQILIGKDHTTPEGMELAKRIEKLFNTRCKEFKNEYHLNFGVYYTPKSFGLGVA